MGIYDRDYYREDAPRWGAGHASRGTIFVMAATIGLFFVQALTTRPGRTSELLVWGEFHFGKIAGGEIWRIFTAGLIPSPDLFGVIVSMFLLYWAGRELERNYGTKVFVAFYILAAWVSSSAKLAVGLAGIDADKTSVGIGGAVFAAMVLFACSNPRRTVLVFFFLPMPLALLVGILLGLTVLAMLSDQTKIHAVGVIAGAAFGFCFFKFAPAILHWTSTRRSAKRQRSPVRLYQSPPDDSEDDTRLQEPEANRPAAQVLPRPNKVIDEQLEAKLDQVLSKVAQLGRESLSADEYEILRQASEIYKRKRT